MNKSYFSYSEKTQKLKSKLLVLSAISLFIGLTQSLPTKVSVIGLDLTDNEAVLAWFIFGITFILFLHFLSLAIIEIANYYAPSLLRTKIENTTGNTIGLTMGDFESAQAEAEYSEQQHEQGTQTAELRDIGENITKIQTKFTRRNLRVFNGVSLLMEFILPVGLAVLGLFYLIQFMSCLK